MLLHGAAKCARCTHMAGVLKKKFQLFFFYTDILSCRARTELCVRLCFRNAAPKSVEKEISLKDRERIQDAVVYVTHNLAASCRKVLAANIESVSIIKLGKKLYLRDGAIV